MRMRSFTRAGLVMGLLLAVATRLPGQSPLFVLDVQGTPLDEFPNGVKALNGVMTTVDKNGQRMLMATSPSEFLITLPQVLPAAFTVILDIVPKRCCAPDDIMLEGTPTRNRGVASVELTWHPERISAVGGGGDMYQSNMPDDLAAAAPENPTQLVFEFNGTTIKLYTNGRRLYTLDKQFARGRVLRVWLGGESATNPMYLAGLSVLDGAVAQAVIAANTPGGSGGVSTNPPSRPMPNLPPNPSNTYVPPVPPGTGTQPSVPPSNPPFVPPPPGSQTASTTQGMTGSPIPTFVANVSVTQQSAGPLVSWLAVAAPATYSVQRWKIDDQTCCNNQSGNLTAPPWQDVQPPLAGTYVYQVTVTTNGGSATGRAQFINFKQGGTIANAGLTPTPSSGPRTPASTSSTPIVNPPIGANTSVPLFTVTVNAGTPGPVVSWPRVPNATGYMVTRSKIDDYNCCNSSSGRTWGATSPWQDGPLPVPGTYIYTVLVNTSTLGRIQAQAQYTLAAPITAVPVTPNTTGSITPMPAPVTAVPATPNTTGTITPMPAPPPAPVASAPTAQPRAPSTTVMSNAPAPQNLMVTGTPVVADLQWDPVGGAVQYVVRRAMAGTTTWTLLPGDPNYPDATTLSDNFPDSRQTYTYEVLAYQGDGSYGKAAKDYTPPTPSDPSSFTATQTGPGQVTFQWATVPGVWNYLIAGPATGAGITAYGGAHRGGQTNSYVISNVPVGTHTWTIAASWQPGGVLTPSTSWPTASATVTAAPIGTHYRLVALGFKAEAQSRDINDARDGHGDEVYFAAIVNRTTFTGFQLPVTLGANLTMVMSRTHGDEAVSVPYGRIKAGTATASGGIQSGDLVPANLDLGAATGNPATLTFPIVVWDGVLDDQGVVVVHPALFEDDVNPIVQAVWANAIFTAAPSGYVVEPPVYDGYISSGYISHATADIIYKKSDFSKLPASIYAIFNPGITGAWAGLGSELFVCTTIAFNLTRRPCEAHGVDRPLGLYGSDNPEAWHERIIVLTRAAIEKALADNRTYPGWAPGTFMVPLNDCGGCDLNTTEAIANYTLYLRIERMP